MASNTDQHQQLPRAERWEKGKALRHQLPRSGHGEWMPRQDRFDPVDLLQAQDVGRLQHLVPIKYGRMSASPFAFLRGSAAILANDLAPTPSTGLNAVLCGDAHLSNFGLFASPERNLIFDINDFDEAYFGPWEWDLKRLAASAAVAGREKGYSDARCRELAEYTACAYRRSIRRFAEMRTLDIWYYLVDMERLRDIFDDNSSKAARKLIERMVQKARKRTQAQTLEKLTVVESGRRRFVSEPPLLVPLRDQSDELAEIVGRGETPDYARKVIRLAWAQYIESLPYARQRLLRRFRLNDMALRVGGVGSVGTRCVIVLLEGGAEEDALILQLKEAGPSVLEAHAPVAVHTYGSHAERVVQGQRLMQTTGDIFLGWHSSRFSGHDYYWRQLKDMKGSVDVEDLDKEGFKTYMGVCALCLARAHARTGDAAAIGGYLGKGDAIDTAIGEFAMLYADQTERDHERLVEAIELGRVVAEKGT